MLNQDKYTTAEERVKAFDEFCEETDANVCGVKCVAYGANLGRNGCFARWLALEAEDEKPEPCPFCGKSCTAHKGIDMVRPHVSCDNDWCGYKSAEEPTIPEAIAAHNRVARAARGEGGAE